MILFLFLFFAILTIYMEKSTKDTKKVYAFFSFLLLFLIMGFRDPSVGTDIQAYLYRYNYETPNLKTFISEFNLISFFTEEGGFKLLNSILKTLRFNDLHYVMFYSLVFSLSFVLFYYKYSKNVFISILLYITIGNFAMSMTGLRQTMAIIIVLYSFKYITERKFLKFLLLVIMASTFHLSVLICIPIYFLFGANLKKKDVIFIFCIVLCLIPLNKIFYRYLTSVVSLFPKYQIYIGFPYKLNPLVVLVALSINLFPILFWNIFDDINIQEKKVISFLFICSSLYSVFNIIAMNDVMINRLSFYFKPFNELMIPFVLYYIRGKEEKMILTTVIIMLLIFHFVITTSGSALGIDKYLFFSQN